MNQQRIREWIQLLEKISEKKEEAGTVNNQRQNSEVKTDGKRTI